jgi:hypothetical protein
MKDDELQTVFTTTHPADAEIVRIALEDEGIGAFVDGATQAGFTGALAVHVSVAKKDVARATMLVEELEHGNVPEG